MLRQTCCLWPKAFMPLEIKYGLTLLQVVEWGMAKILTNVILGLMVAGFGIGRAVGETMAVLMVAGNAPIMPTGLLSKVRTLTMNIITDMGYASGDHMTSLFTTGIVLFVFIIFLNFLVNAITRKQVRGGGKV